MSETDIALRAPWFWKWADGGRVVTWNDGTTIAFLEEIERIYRAFPVGGAPRFGTVLLLLAACREFPLPHGERGHIDSLLELLTAQERMPRNLCNAVLRELPKLGELPSEHREPLAAKIDLALTLFEGWSLRRRNDESQHVLEVLKAGRHCELLVPPTGERAANAIVTDLNWLTYALNRFDVEAFPLRRQTGLDALPKPAEVELPPGAAIRNLIAAIEEDHELGAIGRIAKQILAAAQLPRQLADHEELPIGGFTDIAPRGSPDRLLLSELAQDELTLAVRVALNEALYLRREAPPRHPPEDRWLLIDTGVRIWGIPRVFAAGVALASGATARGSLRTFQAVGGAAVPVELTTTAGLTAHMATLGPSAHPGDALEKLLQLAAAERAPPELLLITTIDAIEDAAFMRTLAAIGQAMFYIAAVDREGTFRLLRRTPHGFLPIREAKLDLAALLQSTKPAASLRTSAVGPGLPAIFYADPFPLRLPIAATTVNSAHVHDVGVLTVTPDKRLLLWDEADRYPRQIAAGLPHCNLLAVTPKPIGGFVRGILGSSNGGRLWSLRYEPVSGECITIKLGEHFSGINAATIQSEIALVVTARTVTAINLDTGKREAAANVPELYSHHRERFFSRARRYWSAASFDGSVIRFDEFYKAVGEQPELKYALDVVGIEGPVGIADNGDIIYTSHGVVRIQPVLGKETGEMQRTIKAAEISRDGHRFAIAMTLNSARRSTRKTRIISTIDGTSIEDLRDGSANVEQEIDRLASPATLRHRFSGITLLSNGTLALVSRRDNAWPIEGLRIALAQQPIRLDKESILHFETVDDPEIVGFSLSRATFADGTRVWLDSRGLLHLQSSDCGLAEVTIVLCGGLSVGWASTGESWGNPKFASQLGITPFKAANKYFRPLIARLR